MRESSWNSVEVIYLDRDRVLAELRRAVTEAKQRYPEIQKVYLFGSLTRDDWTAASDADLFVIIADDTAGPGDRARYQIFTSAIATDSLIYSQSEFDHLAREPRSIVALNLPAAIQL